MVKLHVLMYACKKVTEIAHKNDIYALHLYTYIDDNTRTDLRIIWYTLQEREPCLSSVSYRAANNMWLLLYTSHSY